MTRHRLIALFAAMLAVPLLIATAGCATITRGRTQGVGVTSEPAGAQVFIGNRLVGVTPVTLKLPRRGARLLLRKDGYAPAPVSVTRTMSGWIYADIALGVAQTANQGLESTEQIPEAVAITLAVTVGLDLLLGGVFNLEPTVSVVLTPEP